MQQYVLKYKNIFYFATNMIMFAFVNLSIYFKIYFNSLIFNIKIPPKL